MNHSKSLRNTFFLLLILAAAVYSYRPVSNKKLIYQNAALYGIDPVLIMSIIRHESNFNPRALSRAGAKGLMQLMPHTALRFGVGVKDLFNPAQNIKAGCRFIAFLKRKFGGDVRLIIAAYNAGEGAVRRFGNEVPPYEETLNYVDRVMQSMVDIEKPLLTKKDMDPGKIVRAEKES